ncbi:MAG: hypothetical protein HY050_01560 [Actinobacteria bacterium]|nr:hypothetical protein [Actinomycetota bacterium]
MLAGHSYTLRLWQGFQRIQKLDEYLDAVPRADSDPVEIGAFTLFASRAPSPYYALPSRNQPGRVLLSAEDENAARGYERIGFQQVGHTCAVERKKTIS